MKRLHSILSIMLALVLCIGLAVPAMASGEPPSSETVSSEPAQSAVLSIWADPGSDESENAKPMLRFWFPDAGAGLTQSEIDELHAQGFTEFTEEYLYEVIDILHELYDAGFGGIEMTMLADSANYGTELVSKIGWGTPAWVRILCQALATGNSLGKGDGTSFKVDVTMTAHWPLIIDTVDPNDAAQQQELSYVVQEIDPAAIGDTVTLELPAQKTKDNKNGVFLFTDTLVGVTLAKINAGESGSATGDAASGEASGSRVSVDYTSLTPLNASGEAASRAGVPGGAVVYQYIDGLWYDIALIGTGDDLGDPLQAGESVILYPSVENYTFIDAENGGYIYIEDKATGEAVSPDGLAYERTDTTTQMGPQISYSTSFTVTRNGQDITDSVNVYYDSGLTTHMTGAIRLADGSTVPGQVLANATRESFGIVTDLEATAEKPVTERQYMDDTQALYTVSGADIRAAIEAQSPLKDGENWALIPVYRRGSGQVSSGGSTVTMDNRTYSIDYYDTAGAMAVIDYWEENMLDLPVEVYNEAGEPMTVTLRDMLKGNAAGSIFEDSLELSTSGTAWSENMLSDFEAYMGYDATPYLPLLAGLGSYNDPEGMSAKIQADFSNCRELLFNDKHAKVISEWANEIGGGYRFQSGSDDAQRSEYVDIIEADNGSLSSVLRAVGTVNTKGDPENPYLSMEAITSTTIDPDYYTTMIELNMNFVRGINRIVIHGIPFTKSLNGHINAWPGWVFGETALGQGYGCWDSRQAFYDEPEDIRTFTDYVTRIQGLLQEGQEQVPILFVGGGGDARFAELRANGYHYNVTSEYGVMYDNMSPDGIENGVLLPDTLGTRVIVLDNLGTSVDQYAFLERLNEYADAGVKIVIYGNTNISALNGADYGDYDTMTDEKQTDTYAAELFQKLLKNENTITGVSDITGLMAVLQKYAPSPVSFSQTGLEAVNLKEGDTDYYFFYNSALAEGYSGVSYGGVGRGLDLTNVKGVDLSAVITLETDGKNVYKLDPYNGTITELAVTRNADGTASLTLDIPAWDTAMLAVADEIPGAVPAHGEAVPVLDLTDADWQLTIESYGPASDFDPSAQFNETTVSTLTFESVKLGLWKDLAGLVTRDDLIAIGVTDEKLETWSNRISGYGTYLQNGDSLTVDGNAIQYVSGIGTYTTTFDWDGGSTGAVIRFAHENDAYVSDARVNGDMITKITITNTNGTFEFTGINAMSDEVDIGGALAQGENTITVRLVTTLRDREWIEGAATGAPMNKMQSYGLTGLTICAY